MRLVDENERLGFAGVGDVQGKDARAGGGGDRQGGDEGGERRGVEGGGGESVREDGRGGTGGVRLWETWATAVRLREIGVRVRRRGVDSRCRHRLSKPDLSRQLRRLSCRPLPLRPRPPPLRRPQGKTKPKSPAMAFAVISWQSMGSE